MAVLQHKEAEKEEILQHYRSLSMEHDSNESRASAVEAEAQSAHVQLQFA